jgi:hypothetical protein
LKHLIGRKSTLKGLSQHRRYLFKIEGFLVLTLWFAGCQTLPRWESQNPWGLFPPDASLYLQFSVKDNRELLESLLSSVGERGQAKSNVRQGLSYFLDHASTAYFAILRSDPDKPPSSLPCYPWILVGVGEYSSFLLRLSLTPEEGWEMKKIRSREYALSYYQHAGSGIQIALPDSRLLMVSSWWIEFPLRQFVLPPADPSRYFRPPLRTSSLGLYVPKAGIPFLATLFEPTGPPSIEGIEGFSLNLERTGSMHYAAEGSILFGKEEQARSITVFLRLSLASWFLQQQGNGIPASVQIRGKGTSIEFSGIPLPLETIAQFVDSMIDRIMRVPPW